MKKKIADITFAFVTAILSLMSAVAWYFVIKSIISTNNGAEGSILITVLFAIIITVATVVISIWLHNAAHRIK